MKKRIAFGIIGMIVSGVMLRETVMAYMKTYDEGLILLMLVFAAAFACAFVGVAENTPLFGFCSSMFDEGKEADDE